MPVLTNSPPHRCPREQKSASKLGDTDGKIQVDPRLSKEDTAGLLAELNLMKQQRDVDAARVSKALEEAYHAVTRLQILGEGQG